VLPGETVGEPMTGRRLCGDDASFEIGPALSGEGKKVAAKLTSSIWTLCTGSGERTANPLRGSEGRSGWRAKVGGGVVEPDSSLSASAC
jgi:hypothetical protein